MRLLFGVLALFIGKQKLAACNCIRPSGDFRYLYLIIFVFAVSVFATDDVVDQDDDDLIRVSFYIEPSVYWATWCILTDIS